MSEFLQHKSEYLDIFGNTGIETPFGTLDINVEPSSLKRELVGVVDAYYPSSVAAQRTGRERANRLLCVFGGVPLNKVLTPRFGKIMTANGISEQNKAIALRDWEENFARYDKVTASSFANPLDPGEYVFYFNLPFLIKARGITSFSNFTENFRRDWVHERHHFAQAADTVAFAERMARDSGSVQKAVLLYLLGVPTASVVLGVTAASKMVDLIEKLKKVNKPIERRGFIKLLAGVASLAASGKLVADTHGQIGYNLQYNNLSNFEGEAVDVANKTLYTEADLRQTFQFKVS